MITHHSKQTTLKLSAVAAAVALVIGTPVAHAQDNPADQNLEEIVVTGSRIRQREDYVSANPVSTFDSE